MKNRIGIIGGGQLGRMMAIEAKKLGFHVTILDPIQNSPAGQVADTQVIAGYNDEEAILELATLVDYITFEIESTNGMFLDEIEKKTSCIINPSGKSWRLFQDKLEQKKLFQKGSIPQPQFMEIKNKSDMYIAGKRFGYPFLLKARFDAYDGKGNIVIKTKNDFEKAWERFKEKKLYAEEYIHFDKELAVIVARGNRGEIVPYPVVETVQKNNICHYVIAPASISGKARKKALSLATKTMKLLKGSGVFGIEMYKTPQDTILINEIAPRVHNSGHFTIEACITSQFEQHIRAISGLPLGKTDMKVPSAVMVNILGERQGEAYVKGLDKALLIPHVSVHIYGKKDTKNERKMGHITAIDEAVEKAMKKARKARKLITI
jgi:5-(carboxyamino)imidazole ribonucleotide synthase